MSDAIVNAILINNEIKSLGNKIEDLNKQNAILQKRLYWLTIATTFLAFVQTIFLIIQLVHSRIEI